MGGHWTSVLSLPCANGLREKMSLLGTWGLGVEELSEGCRSIWGMLGWVGRWTGSQFTERSCVRVLLSPLLPATPPEVSTVTCQSELHHDL